MSKKSIWEEIIALYKAVKKVQERVYDAPRYPEGDLGRGAALASLKIASEALSEASKNV